MSTTSRPTSRPSGQGSDRPAGPPGRPPRGSLPSARPIGNSPRSPLRGLPDGPQGPRPSGAGAPAPRLAMSRGACRVGGVPWAFPVGLAPRPARRPRVLATACRLVARGTRPAARPPAPTRGSRRLRRIPLPVPQPAEGAFGIRNRSGRAPCRPRLVAFPVALPAGGAPRATGEGDRWQEAGGTAAAACGCGCCRLRRARREAPRTAACRRGCRAPPPPPARGGASGRARCAPRSGCPQCRGRCR